MDVHFHYVYVYFFQASQGLREKLLLVGKLCQKRAPSKTNCT